MHLLNMSEWEHFQSSDEYRVGGYNISGSVTPVEIKGLTLLAGVNVRTEVA